MQFQQYPVRLQTWSSLPPPCTVCRTLLNVKHREYYFFSISLL
jgi:hypothetical protein